MESIKMTRKEFASKALKKIEDKLLLEGFCINEDVDTDEDDYGSAGTYVDWKKSIKSVLGERTFTQKINKEITYKNLEGKNCLITIGENSEYFDKLEKVSKAKAKKYPELWNSMVELVKEIIDKLGKPLMYELDNIRPKASHNTTKTAAGVKAALLTIDAFDVVGFDSFYDGLAKNVIEHPQSKYRAGYTEPVKFVEHTKYGDNTYEGELNVVWNYEPMTYKVYGKYTIKNYYDVDEPEYTFDMIDIRRVEHPLDHSMRYDSTSLKSSQFIASIASKSVWFDVYINLMDYVKRELETKHNIVDIKPMVNVSAQEIIDNVEAQTPNVQ